MIWRRFASCTAAAAGLSATLAGQARLPEWPQWRGPRRDGVVAVFREPATWPEHLTRQWSIEVGLGYAAPLLVGDRLYLFSRQGQNEVMSALDGATGRIVWRVEYPAPFTMNRAAARHGEGPKSTPAYAGGRIYAIGMTGIVTAFEAATGKTVWQKPGGDIAPLYTTHAFSPLVDRGLVIFHVGGHNRGALTAFDAATGAVKWQWDGDGPGYGSPMVVEANGTRQVVTFTQDNLVGVDVATGALLWKRPFSTRATQNTITPILYNDLVVVSGLDRPVSAFRIVKRAGGWDTETVWENPDVPLYMSNAVVARDTLFGFTHRNSGQFFALDLKSGRTVWTSPPRQATNASIVRAGDLLFMLKDDAELVVLRTTASAFEPIRRYQMADSATWAPPVISGNRIYIKDVSTLALWTWDQR